MIREKILLIFPEIYTELIKQGWKGWGDLTGTGNTAVFLKIIENLKARDFERSLNFKNQKNGLNLQKIKKFFQKIYLHIQVNLSST